MNKLLIALLTLGFLFGTSFVYHYKSNLLSSPTNDDSFNIILVGDTGTGDVI